MSEKLIKELGEKIDAFQSVNDRLEKQYDGLDNIVTKELTEKIEKSAQALQDIQMKHDAQIKTIEYLEKMATRGGNAGGETNESELKYRESMVGYLKKGREINYDDLGEYLNLVVKNTYKGLNANEIDLASKALRTDINPDGGYFITNQMLAKMVTRNFETSPMRSICNVITTSNKAVEMIIDDDEAASGGWVSEIGARGNTGTPQVGKLIIEAHEQFAQPLATQAMLDDAGFDVEAWLGKKISDIITRTENTSFVTGNGVGKPNGILNYAAWAAAGTYERNKVEQVVSSVSGSYSADDLIDLQNALQEIYRSNSKWLMKRSSLGTALKLKEATTGAYLIARDILAAGYPLTLLGKPIVFADDMPALASNSLSVAYGDFSEGYTIVDRIGIRVLRDPYTSKPYIKFYTTKRTGGAVTNYEAFKILKSKA